MPTEYVFRCPACGVHSTETEQSLRMYGIPTCKGWEEADVQPDNGPRRSPHERVEMKRVYQVNLMWPKDKRGH